MDYFFTLHLLCSSTENTGNRAKAKQTKATTEHTHRALHSCKSNILLIYYFLTNKSRNVIHLTGTNEFFFPSGVEERELFRGRITFFFPLRKWSVAIYYENLHRCD